LLHLKEDTALVLSQVQKDPTQGCPIKKTAMAAMNPHYYIACQPLVIFAVFASDRLILRLLPGATRTSGPATATT